MNAKSPKFLTPGGCPPGSSRLLRLARRIMIATGLVVGLMQIVQHVQYGGQLEFNFFLIVEVLVYAVILPLAGIYILGLLERSEQARLASDESITRQVALVRRLGGAAGWNELVERVVEFPPYILPVRTSSLYLYNSQSREFSLAAVWSQSGPRAIGTPIPLSTELCPQCRQSLHTRLHRLQLSPGGGAGSEPIPTYSLPLVLGGQAIGILHITLPQGVDLDPVQAAELDGISTDLALVLDRAALRNTALSQAQANAAERQRIAQDLHDTLAQNIAYLRLKLEQLLMEEDPRRQISLIHKELSHMRDTADEAYAQVRETLAILKAGESRELSQVILERASTVGERAGFQVQLRQEGQPRLLEPFLRRQVTYISREALTNIEKHSRASRVEIALGWQPDCLELSIRDDGVGFEAPPSAPFGSASRGTPGEGAAESEHYGLAIMRERAESIQGELEVQSAPSQGTAIHLRVPLKQPAKTPQAN